MIIIVSVFVVITITIMFMFLKQTAKKFGKLSKDLFVDKLQIYDELIEEKEKKLKELNNSETIKEKENSEVNNKDVVYVVNNNNNIEYQDEELFKKMKEIDKKFQLNNHKVICSFVNKIKNNINQDDINKFNFYQNILNKLTDDLMYSIVILTPKQQINKLRKVLNENEIIDLKNYYNVNKKLDLVKYKSYVNNLLIKFDPHIYIYSGSKSDNYCDISELIVMKYDDSIYKGIKIVYKSVAYDYTLR